MTQEPTKTDIIDVESVDHTDTFESRAKASLVPADYEDMMGYIDRGGSEIALSTANKFFELYISGNDVEDIHKLNPAFPRSAINWLRIKYDWDSMREQLMRKMQNQIADKVMKAQFEAASLYSDIISAAHKKHSENLKKYIQTGDKKYLEDTIDINSVHQLQKVVDGLQKVTGQDRKITVSEEKRVSVDVNVDGGESFGSDAASKILAIVAEEKRKKDTKGG